MIEYTVEREIATVGNKKLTVTRWGSNPAKLDLRTWRTVDGQETPGKGVTLSDEEAVTLHCALMAYLNGE